MPKAQTLETSPPNDVLVCQWIWQGLQRSDSEEDSEFVKHDKFLRLQV